LSDEQRQMFDETNDELADYIFELQDQYNQERLEKIKEAKPDMQMIELTEEERQAFEERAQQVREEYVNMVGGDAEQVLNDLQAEIEAAEGS
ncbi:MAG: C4-dicarboxylate ABC transporter, partial [Geminicoccaceae bacterium]|nr:C4-dicarboxylate ABC transporter [Geminicoccaceae bacterium]